MGRAVPTHGHERGIIGAQATALAIWLARQGASADEVRRRVAELSGYDMDRTTDQIRPDYRFQVSSDLSVPEAIIARMRRANEKSKDHAVAEGIAIAREMLERIQPIVQGVQVSAPFGKVELALQVFG